MSSDHNQTKQTSSQEELQQRVLAPQRISHRPRFQRITPYVAETATMRNDSPTSHAIAEELQPGAPIASAHVPSEALQEPRPTPSLPARQPPSSIGMRHMPRRGLLKNIATAQEEMQTTIPEQPTAQLSPVPTNELTFQAVEQPTTPMAQVPPIQTASITSSTYNYDSPTALMEAISQQLPAITITRTSTPPPSSISTARSQVAIADVSSQVAIADVSSQIATADVSSQITDFSAPPAEKTLEKGSLVERYAQWLKINNSLQVAPEKLQAYQNASLSVTKVGNRDVCIYAPFQVRSSALKVITPPQVVVLLLLLAGWLLGLILLHMTMIAATLGCVTVLYICGFAISSLLATNSFGNTSGEQIDETLIDELDAYGVEWPTYTILCPLYKEVAVVPQFVQAIRALHYPQDRLQVLFLTEENDSATRTAIYNLGLPRNFTILTVPKGTPQTKPRACNFGLLQASGQFIVIFDAEDKPEPYQLKKAVLTFANQGAEVACIQAKLNYYNSKQNILTHWFTAEYSTWFDIMLPGLQQSKLSLPLGGTSNHFRTEVLRALGGWDAFNVTEDCDLGLRISQYGLKTAVLDSTTYEEATSRPKVWIYQRSRWIKGYFQTYLVHMRHPTQMLRKGHYLTFLSLQLIVGVWSLVLLINPLMWALTLAYFILQPVTLYSKLFPGPVLYMGMFCLVFGNFFYIYIHLLGCLRRREFALIKWVLLIPLYWVMMSISAYIAFYQLIVKPHYWEKTQHGNHLAPGAKLALSEVSADDEGEARSVASSMPTTRMLALNLSNSLKLKAVGTSLDSTTQRVAALRVTLTQQLGDKQRRTWRWPHIDGWLAAALGIALVASVTATLYFLKQHRILLYSDAYAQLRIARMFFDSTTPGIGQLGTTWLPLPHLLMLPFVWNDYLWRTGLAGSIPAMLCYIVVMIFLFLTARRLTKSSPASFVAALIFIINPNILYLQSTPLSELVSIATLTLTGYYFLAWVQEQRIRQLILAAAGILLATMTSYDGWVLAAAMIILIPIIGLLKRQRIRQIEANFLVFVILSSLGIALWLVYNQQLTGNALSFLRNVSSSSTQALNLQGNQLTAATYHNLWQAIRYYAIATIDIAGPVLCTLAIFGLCVFLLRKRPLSEKLATLTFLIPFGIYSFSLYLGKTTLAVPGAVPVGTSLHDQLFNAHIGTVMVVPIALFIATMLAGWQLASFSRFFSFVARTACIVIAIIQSLVIISSGIITLQDGEYGISCQPTHPINIYLAQHYDDGRILEELSHSPIDGADANFPLKNAVSEGDYHSWSQALAHPEQQVDWIILNPTDRSDTVAQDIHIQSPEFKKNFTLVVKESTGLRLYHKKGVSSLPTRSIPYYLTAEHQACATSSYMHTL
jgi:Glycosyltransferases, probably involved in cell wall biogenesis